MSLPVLDLRLLRADHWSARDLVGDALRGTGALTLRFPQAEVDNANFDLLLGLFDLPESSKWQVARRSVRPGSAFEWVGYGFDPVNGVIAHETFDLGPRGAAPVADVQGMTAPFEQVTPLPKGLGSGWLTAAERLRIILGDTGRDLIRLIARSLGRDEEAATSRFSPDDSTLRILNYPATQPDSVPPLRAAEHEDSGALTFIWSDLPGLEVLAQDQRWVAASSHTWTVICGHVLSEMTDGAITPTTHRVSDARGRRRSLAYFFEPRHSASVLPWPPVGSTAQVPTIGDEYGRWLSRRHGG